MLDYAAEGFTMPGSDETRIIRFGVFEVDLQTGELRRNGFQIRLQEQPFQVLATLLQRHGELVTRDELRRALWPADTFVDFDHSLNAAIKRLRDALGESAETPRFVQTVARRGYRFIAPVEPSSIAGKATIPTDTKRLLEQTAKSGRELRGRHALTLVLGGALVAALGVGALWILKHRVSSGQELIVRRLTSNSSDNPVTGALLSPDGKYLAFRDQTGMHLKLIETGEIQTISPRSEQRISALGRWNAMVPRSMVSGQHKTAGQCHSARPGTVPEYLGDLALRSGPARTSRRRVSRIHVPKRFDGRVHCRRWLCS